MTPIRFIASDSIRSCPWLIMMPEHYDESTGSCRCDDPNHAEMVEWGYIWDPKRKRWAALVDAAEWNNEEE